MSDTIRLDKALAAQISCSRSEAVKYIEGGFVTVDGKVVEEPGFRMLPEQCVELKPDAILDTVEEVTILFHKPAGLDIESDSTSVLNIITPETHAAVDRSGIRFIRRHLKGQTLVDPLGIQSSGLVVWSQNWRVGRKLVTDAAKVEHEYIVEVSGQIMPDGLETLNKGIQVKGQLLQLKASWQNENRLRFAMKGNQRSRIAELCAAVGLTVQAMKRIRIGRIPLASLPVGQWRYLQGYEKF